MKGLIISLLLLAINSIQAQKVPKNTGSELTRKDAQQALDFHNKIRKEVGAPPLVWSEELSSYAQQWANKLARNCKMEHRPVSGKWGRKFGENLYWGMGKEYTAFDASEAWYSEIKLYHFENIDQSNWHATGHYTQMVWSKTKKIGIAVARCKGGQTIIVANYDPPGNYMGEKPY